ncbi:MAG: hypothetical protein LBI06_01880 [Treponema sp.]|nr:hypothetical protein [Treponema sp.]
MQISILISFLIIIFGIGNLFLAIKLRRRSFYLFFAALFLQTGLFLLLNSIDVINIGYPNAWPLLSIFTGLALLPAGRQRYGAIKANYIVLSVAFIILGAIMMFFSMKLTSFSLKQFVSDWWVLLILMAGLTLILITLGIKLSEKARGQV